MRTLHIPDIHEELATLKWILEKYESEVDHTIFHGDFFDSHAYSGDPRAAVMMARWLKDNVSQPRRTFLYGNHDIGYTYSVAGLYCSGYSDLKKIMIQEIFGREVWDQFKLFEHINGWLCSHAGINESMLHPIKGFDIDYLREQEKKCFQDLSLNLMNTMVGPGRIRGGPFPHGGITWQDSREFEDIEGVRQLFGHTPGDTPRLIGNSYCFDCYKERTPLQYIAIIEDGNPEFISVPHLDNNWPWESKATKFSRSRPRKPQINYNR